MLCIMVCVVAGVVIVILLIFVAAIPHPWLPFV